MKNVSFNPINPSPDADSIRHHQRFLDLSSTSQLLTRGGDSRIVCDRPFGQNKYGCRPFPEPDVLSYGSSTASIITIRSFSAAERLRQRLAEASRLEPAASTYAHELERMRAELLEYCGVSNPSDVDVIFAASGTDAHLIAAQLANDVNSPGLLVVMTDPAETGSGVPAALTGRHFNDSTALGKVVEPGAAFFGGCAADIVTVPNRAADGTPRPSDVVDAEFEAFVGDAVKRGSRVLVQLVDVSKTGMILPSLTCALNLRDRHPEKVQILVDACQFRLAPATLRAYLQAGLWVALTGSKFVGGPAFSGALLLPEAAACELRTRALPPALSDYSTRADWPAGWFARQMLPDVANYGLLLRWEAALTELRSFRSLPKSAIENFLKKFASRIGQRLSSDAALQSLAVPELDRCPLVDNNAWDGRSTIFPFILRHSPDRWGHRLPLNREEAALVYKRLRHVELVDVGVSAELRAIAARRCALGQPVQCGVVSGVPVSALRLCVSIPLIIDAVSEAGRGSETVMDEAVQVLDKAVLLAQMIDGRDPA